MLVWIKKATIVLLASQPLILPTHAILMIYLRFLLLHHKKIKVEREFWIKRCYHTQWATLQWQLWTQLFESVSSNQNLLSVQKCFVSFYFWLIREKLVIFILNSLFVLFIYNFLKVNSPRLQKKSRMFWSSTRNAIIIFKENPIFISIFVKLSSIKSSVDVQVSFSRRERQMCFSTIVNWVISDRIFISPPEKAEFCAKKKLLGPSVELRLDWRSAPMKNSFGQAGKEIYCKILASTRLELLLTRVAMGHEAAARFRRHRSCA